MRIRVIHLTVLIVAGVMLQVSLAPAAEAISAKQRKLFYGKIYAFDEDISCPSQSGGAANINVDQGFSLGTDPAERRVNLIRALMQDFNLTPQQAAGPVGNFMLESGGPDLPPDVNEGGTPGPPAFSGGYGWAQWTGSRQRNFIDFAIAGGYMPNEGAHATDAANYAWFKHELTTSYTSTIPELQRQQSPEDAAVSFEDTFENAGVQALPQRSANARQAYDEYVAAGGDQGDSPGGGGDTTSSGGCGRSTGGIVGDVAFPLGPTRSVVNNPSMFANGTASTGHHDYTAFDILAHPGTQVRAFADGKVSALSRDVCGGRLISIFNQQEDFVVSYLHNRYEDHVAEDTTVTHGDHIALVGDPNLGCSAPHLHIDAMQGDQRAACSTGDCPRNVRDLFIDIGPQLFETFQELPEGNI